ncbi:hypothetical protein, partial [Micromonospora sp. 4G55]|uniref:hypothetical protein n=1 Tax=Micromonospora sp. 4G55 TaxID=2806102 RepID=UPI001EE40EFB
MKLVWRRAREARGLLLAAAVAALVAVALVTGLSDYNQRAIDAGQRGDAGGGTRRRAQPADQRLRSAGSAAEATGRDRTVRDRFAGGLGG